VIKIIDGKMNIQDVQAEMQLDAAELKDFKNVMYNEEEDIVEGVITVREFWNFVENLGKE
jgi:hypothetical protein